MMVKKEREESIKISDSPPNLQTFLQINMTTRGSGQLWYLMWFLQKAFLWEPDL